MKKKKFGVRSKLLVFILPIVIVGFLVLILIANSSSRNSLAEKTADLLEAEAETGVNAITTWQSENLSLFDTVVDTMINLRMTDEEIINYESFYLGTYEDFPNGFYTTYSNGVVLDASGWQPEGDAT